MAVLTATKTPDTVTGTEGADVITGSSGVDRLVGFGGNDTITGSVGDVISGDEGDDSLTGAASWIYGGNGNDTIEGGLSESSDFLDGGPGDDTIIVHSSLSTIMFEGIFMGGVRVDLNQAVQNLGSGYGIDTYVGRVSNLIGTRGDDVLINSNDGGRIQFYDGWGNDYVDSGKSSTTFYADRGDDTLIGGGARDKIDFHGIVVSRNFSTLTPVSGVHVDLSQTGPQDIGAGFGRDTLVGIEDVSGTFYADYIVGSAANNVIYGLGDLGESSGDTVYGGGGDDLIDVSNGLNGFARGDDGAEFIRGGGGFDDLLGNKGNDTLYGGAGNDWVVGGQDADRLFGENGFDIVYGNLGADTCEGGDGDNWVRGGQGDDVVIGGAGADFVAGDRGNDTLSGGAGADRFHTFGDAGLDRVTDFSRAEGDRVEVEAGTTWTVAQTGADVVISMSGGAQMILVGVQLSSLTGGWIGYG